MGQANAFECEIVLLNVVKDGGCVGAGVKKYGLRSSRSLVEVGIDDHVSVVRGEGGDFGKVGLLGIPGFLC